MQASIQQHRTMYPFLQYLLTKTDPYPHFSSSQKSHSEDVPIIETGLSPPPQKLHGRLSAKTFVFHCIPVEHCLRNTSLLTCRHTSTCVGTGLGSPQLAPVSPLPQPCCLSRSRSDTSFPGDECNGPVCPISPLSASSYPFLNSYVPRLLVLKDLPLSCALLAENDSNRFFSFVTCWFAFLPGFSRFNSHGSSPVAY